MTLSELVMSITQAVSLVYSVTIGNPTSRGRVVQLMVRGTRHDSEILGAIIPAITIHMMNDLARIQFSTKCDFHDQSVFPHVSRAVRSWMPRGIDANVAVGRTRSSALPPRSSHALEMMAMDESTRLPAMNRRRLTASTRAQLFHHSSCCLVVDYTKYGRDSA